MFHLLFKVQEAIQLNKKLTSVNKKQETEISNLKEVSIVCISKCVGGLLLDLFKLLYCQWKQYTSSMQLFFIL